MSKPHIELAFDTSGAGGTLALARDGVLLVARPLIEGRRHNVELVATIAEEMAKFKLAPADLTVVHVGVGPGSFTGLRTACAAAQALALALPDCRFTRVAALDALRHQEAQVLPTCAIAASLAWKRDTAWGAVYDAAGTALLAAGEHTFEALFATCPSGTRWVGETPPDLQWPAHVARAPAAGVQGTSVWALGRAAAAQGLFVAQADLLPIYPRQPEAVSLWQARKPKNP